MTNLQLVSFQTLIELARKEKGYDLDLIIDQFRQMLINCLIYNEPGTELYAKVEPLMVRFVYTAMTHTKNQFIARFRKEYEVMTGVDPTRMVE